MHYNNYLQFRRPRWVNSSRVRRGEDVVLPIASRLLITPEGWPPFMATHLSCVQHTPTWPSRLWVTLCVRATWVFVSSWWLLWTEIGLNPFSCSMRWSVIEMCRRWWRWCWCAWGFKGGGGRSRWSIEIEVDADLLMDFIALSRVDNSLTHSLTDCSLMVVWIEVSGFTSM